MHHNVSLIATLAAAFGLALILGFIAARLKLPALVGYLLAGIVLGPFTPGFIADVDLANQLAEIGVMLLMFGVGLHFSLDDLMEVKGIALPGAILQISAATLLGLGVATFMGWTFGAGLVFGLALSVASTVVLLRALEERGELDSLNGRIAVGWLVVEDLVMVLVLVMLPALSGWLGGKSPDGGGSLWTTLVVTLGQVGIFIALMLVVGRKVFPWLLWQVARTNSRELFTLCVIAAAIGIAYGSAKLFGVSFALGAFFAGMVLRESELSHRAAEDSLPLQDAFSVLFFVSVGMLFDPAILSEQPLQVLAVVLIIMLGKSVAAFLLVLWLRYPLNTALTVSASLAQIGEFSFILMALGLSLGLLPPEAQSLVLAGAILSIALNPFTFKAIAPLQKWLHSHSYLARKFDWPADPLAELPVEVPQEKLTRQVVLVGFGRVGKRIAEKLTLANISYVVVESNREIVQNLRRNNIPAVAGNAAEPAILIQAHIAKASFLVIATPDTFHVRSMIEIARALNPDIQTIVRTHSEEEAALLRRENAGHILMGEHELAKGMAAHVIARLEHHDLQSSVASFERALR
ncbi:MAG TPA: YbaL family putative K(+) efflux transporter [Noviherbaspirillum sp.]|jgi:CPA2 family monovalent cation:H+ antiporter-2|uniref:YbaL family putative K(+) efflux transporter n=1 Tax=Noviherbaspirillum sp. TaxID=1926288 RepID=UPI002DDD23DA|nr:YbaL family putative K(+) efflux transporter [Noviherbaspirillum sp.]HEV2612620.1 YbaL family putative K(+) efflux transporter [Noviherbaspirillum sp.]